VQKALVQLPVLTIGRNTNSMVGAADESPKAQIFGDLERMAPQKKFAPDCPHQRAFTCFIMPEITLIYRYSTHSNKKRGFLNCLKLFHPHTFKVSFDCFSFGFK